MKVKSLKIATVEGRFVRMNEEFELNDKVAAKYIEAGFVEEVIVVSVEAKEPKTPVKKEN